MPIKLFCDLCEEETKENWSLTSVNFDEKGVKTIRGIERIGKNQGIICKKCLIKELQK